ncbi:MAG: hypothetical protein IPN13_07975 [Bacteroidetes bacterium]|nr:hypothetical protein [Bacteroidota bacterium]
MRLHKNSVAMTVINSLPIDTIWGREVKDTYRWMEDIRSPETLNWLKTQDTLRDNYKERN